MGESEDCSSNRSVPGNGPVSSILDSLGRLNRSKRDLDVSESLNLEVVMGGGELPAENCVEVDRPPRNDVVPLRIWELRTVGFICEGTLRRFGSIV